MEKQKTLYRQIAEALANRRLRWHLCKRSKFVFGLYYMRHYFFRPIAEFHKVMAQDLEFRGHRFLLWIHFRESAKTTWGRIAALHWICYGLKKDIGWVAHDLRKAQRRVMSIANELKSNRRIIRDFGQLFIEQPGERKYKSKFKTFGEFTTTNGVSIKAISTNVSTRGDSSDQFRPDAYILDDIENMKTARSAEMTGAVIQFVDELIAGRAVDCDILILANRIARNGSVAYIEKLLAGNPLAKIHEVKAIENDKITWPGRFVWTEAEAKALNAKIVNPKKHIESIEQKKGSWGLSGLNSK